MESNSIYSPSHEKEYPNNKNRLSPESKDRLSPEKLP